MSKKSLTLTTYSPNFRDPRVRKRVGIVMEFCIPLLVDGGPREVSAKMLTKVFGNQTSNALSVWLRANLLRQTGFYQVGLHPFAYEVHPAGVEKVLQMLKDSEWSESRTDDQRALQ